MPNYLVEVPEIHIAIVSIYAKNPEEALEKVRKEVDNKTECDECFFSHALNASKEHQWIVKNEEDDKELLIDEGDKNV